MAQEQIFASFRNALRGIFTRVTITLIFSVFDCFVMGFLEVGAGWLAGCGCAFVYAFQKFYKLFKCSKLSVTVHSTCQSTNKALLQHKTKDSSCNKTGYTVHQ